MAFGNTGMNWMDWAKVLLPVAAGAAGTPAGLPAGQASAILPGAARAAAPAAAAAAPSLISMTSGANMPEFQGIKPGGMINAADPNSPFATAKGGLGAKLGGFAENLFGTPEGRLAVTKVAGFLAPPGSTSDRMAQAAGGMAEGQAYGNQVNQLAAHGALSLAKTQTEAQLKALKEAHGASQDSMLGDLSQPMDAGQMIWPPSWGQPTTPNFNPPAAVSAPVAGAAQPSASVPAAPATQVSVQPEPPPKLPLSFLSPELQAKAAAQAASMAESQRAAETFPLEQESKRQQIIRMRRENALGTELDPVTLAEKRFDYQQKLEDAKPDSAASRRAEAVIRNLDAQTKAMGMKDPQFEAQYNQVKLELEQERTNSEILRQNDLQSKIEERRKPKPLTPSEARIEKDNQLKAIDSQLKMMGVTLIGDKLFTLPKKQMKDPNDAAGLKMLPEQPARPLDWNSLPAVARTQIETLYQQRKHIQDQSQAKTLPLELEPELEQAAQLYVNAGKYKTLDEAKAYLRAQAGY